MNLSPPVIETLQRVVRFLEANDIDYMVVGGLAVRLLTLPRTTFDVDVMVAVGEDECGRFAKAADDAGFQVDEAFRRGFVDRLAGLGKIHFHWMHGTRTVRVDVFILGSEYQRAAFTRRTIHETPLGRLSLMSLEDLLLHKLMADRPRDRSDVADLFLVSGPLDMEYVREWAAKLGVSERLDRTLRDLG